MDVSEHNVVSVGGRSELTKRAEEKEEKTEGARKVKYLCKLEALAARMDL